MHCAGNPLLEESVIVRHATWFRQARPATAFMRVPNAFRERLIDGGMLPSDLGGKVGQAVRQ
jgi:hypothetical protein